MRTVRGMTGLAGMIALALLVSAAPPPPVVLAPAAPARPALTALGAVMPGMWRLRMLDGRNQPPHDICVADRQALMQLRHPGVACETLVVANGPKVTTLQYSCRGAGWGRTSLHLETPTVVQIDTQGIADKAPFAFLVEARRIGDCRAPHAAAAR